LSPDAKAEHAAGAWDIPARCAGEGVNSLLMNSHSRSSQGNEAHSSSRTKASSEPPYVGCYFFNARLRHRELERITVDVAAADGDVPRSALVRLRRPEIACPMRSNGCKVVRLLRIHTT
jgi:hypothetical protein